MRHHVASQQQQAHTSLLLGFILVLGTPWLPLAGSSAERHGDEATWPLAAVLGTLGAAISAGCLLICLLANLLDVCVRGRISLKAVLHGGTSSPSSSRLLRLLPWTAVLTSASLALWPPLQQGLPLGGSVLPLLHAAILALLQARGASKASTWLWTLSLVATQVYAVLQELPDLQAAVSWGQGLMPAAAAAASFNSTQEAAGLASTPGSASGQPEGVTCAWGDAGAARDASITCSSADGGSHGLGAWSGYNTVSERLILALLQLGALLCSPLLAPLISSMLGIQAHTQSRKPKASSHGMIAKSGKAHAPILVDLLSSHPDPGSPSQHGPDGHSLPTPFEGLFDSDSASVVSNGETDPFRLLCSDMLHSRSFHKGSFTCSALDTPQDGSPTLHAAPSCGLSGAAERASAGKRALLLLRLLDAVVWLCLCAFFTGSHIFVRPTAPVGMAWMQQHSAGGVSSLPVLGMQLQPLPHAMEPRGMATAVLGAAPASLYQTTAVGGSLASVEAGTAVQPVFLVLCMLLACLCVGLVLLEAYLAACAPSEADAVQPLPMQGVPELAITLACKAALLLVSPPAGLPVRQLLLLGLMISALALGSRASLTQRWTCASLVVSVAALLLAGAAPHSSLLCACTTWAAALLLPLVLHHAHQCWGVAEAEVPATFGSGAATHGLAEYRSSTPRSRFAPSHTPRSLVHRSTGDANAGAPGRTSVSPQTEAGQQVGEAVGHLAVPAGAPAAPEVGTQANRWQVLQVQAPPSQARRLRYEQGSAGQPASAEEHQQPGSAGSSSITFASHNETQSGAEQPPGIAAARAAPGAACEGQGGFDGGPGALAGLHGTSQSRAGILGSHLRSIPEEEQQQAVGQHERMQDWLLQHGGEPSFTSRSSPLLMLAAEQVQQMAGAARSAPELSNLQQVHPPPNREQQMLQELHAAASAYDQLVCRVGQAMHTHLPQPQLQHRDNHGPAIDSAASCPQFDLAPPGPQTITWPRMDAMRLPAPIPQPAAQPSRILQSAPAGMPDPVAANARHSAPQYEGVPPMWPHAPVHGFILPAVAPNLAPRRRRPQGPHMGSVHSSSRPGPQVARSSSSSSMGVGSSNTVHPVPDGFASSPLPSPIRLSSAGGSEQLSGLGSAGTRSTSDAGLMPLPGMHVWDHASSAHTDCCEALMRVGCMCSSSDNTSMQAGAGSAMLPHGLMRGPGSTHSELARSSQSQRLSAGAATAAAGYSSSSTGNLHPHVVYSYGTADARVNIRAPDAVHAGVASKAAAAAAAQQQGVVSGQLQRQLGASAAPPEGPSGFIGALSNAAAKRLQPGMQQQQQVVAEHLPAWPQVVPPRRASFSEAAQPAAVLTAAAAVPPSVNDARMAGSAAAVRPAGVHTQHTAAPQLGSMGPAFPTSHPHPNGVGHHPHWRHESSIATKPMAATTAAAAAARSPSRQQPAGSQRGAWLAGLAERVPAPPSYTSYAPPRHWAEQLNMALERLLVPEQSPDGFAATGFSGSGANAQPASGYSGGLPRLHEQHSMGLTSTSRELSTGHMRELIMLGSTNNSARNAPEAKQQQVLLQSIQASSAPPTPAPAAPAAVSHSMGAAAVPAASHGQSTPAPPDGTAANSTSNVPRYIKRGPYSSMRAHLLGEQPAAASAALSLPASAAVASQGMPAAGFLSGGAYSGASAPMSAVSAGGSGSDLARASMPSPGSRPPLHKHRMGSRSLRRSSSSSSRRAAAAGVLHHLLGPGVLEQSGLVSAVSAPAARMAPGTVNASPPPSRSFQATTRSSNASRQSTLASIPETLAVFGGDDDAGPRQWVTAVGGVNGVLPPRRAASWGTPGIAAPLPPALHAASGPGAAPHAAPSSSHIAAAWAAAGEGRHGDSTEQQQHLVAGAVPATSSGPARASSVPGGSMPAAPAALHVISHATACRTQPSQQPGSSAVAARSDAAAAALVSQQPQLGGVNAAGAAGRAAVQPGMQDAAWRGKAHLNAAGVAQQPQQQQSPAGQLRDVATTSSQHQVAHQGWSAGLLDVSAGRPHPGVGSVSDPGSASWQVPHPTTSAPTDQLAAEAQGAGPGSSGDVSRAQHVWYGSTASGNVRTPPKPLFNAADALNRMRASLGGASNTSSTDAA